MKYGEYDLNIIIVPIMGTNCYFLSHNGKTILRFQIKLFK